MGLNIHPLNLAFACMQQLNLFSVLSQSCRFLRTYIALALGALGHGCRGNNIKHDMMCNRNVDNTASAEGCEKGRPNACAAVSLAVETYSLTTCSDLWDRRFSLGFHWHGKSDAAHSAEEKVIAKPAF
jgi:hypothetical protein